MGELVEFSEKSTKKGARQGWGQKGMKGKSFLANSMKAEMGRVLLAPLFDANSQSEKNLVKFITTES